ncbi:MAG: metalloregulator ArsR/SmtB family transcription factor [Scytonematopsis contorta HA4267-MV1]|jgi:ATP-dependent Clp protease ATP-binding subunit ClpC|nr:metalloregulator ArsR/SmtB family transcription factor [Scytonematopsis contorta HA4267-MV1]
MNEDTAHYADVFAALGSEPRLDIMRLLFAAYPRGMPVGDLQAQLQIPNSTLSHHLEKLRVEGLVTVQRDRQFLWYSANVETIEALLAFLYNGCSVRNQVSHTEVSRTEQAQQILEKDLEQSLEKNLKQNNENKPPEEGFMFENFLRSIQSFLSGFQIELPGFERFTQKAIQSILTAKDESRRLQHQYVGTEQMLVGLLSQETGLITQFFSTVGVQLEPVKQAVEHHIGRGRGTPEEIPFTPRAKQTLEIALRQAKQFGHSYIGTEHLLLGILIEGKGLGARILEELGFNCKTLEQELRNVINQNSV